MKSLIAALIATGLVLAANDKPLFAQSETGDSAKQRQDRRQRMLRNREGRMARDDDAPKVGDVAPVFTLKSHDGESETDLAAFAGERPVVLIFGSYT